jgi:hypothetical protein
MHQLAPTRAKRNSDTRPQPAAGHRHFALNSGFPPPRGRMPPRAVNSPENGRKQNDCKGFIENWFRVSEKEFRSPHAQKSTTLHNPAAGPRPLWVPS